MVVNVIGAGLAGSEATYQLIKRGIKVRLYEMRPLKSTPAHQTSLFAELVCSNSFRAMQIENAVGLLKEEMRLLDSMIMRYADQTSIPAGGALAVDRIAFGSAVTNYLKNHPLVECMTEEILTIPKGLTIVATGPLTSDQLSEDLQRFLGNTYLYFYDAVAPIILADSVDYKKVYLKSRYDKGEASYYNCPMTEAEFDLFYDALIHAERVEPKDFEMKVFEACMAIEDMAMRGKKTLLFGPMKPVGLEHPLTKEIPYAVVQLRQDDAKKTMFNLVGFQTHLKWGEQKRILQLIPGLESCEIVRYGVMHRNTYIHGPQILNQYYQAKTRLDLFFAGQITGVEGYLESAASGMVAGINMARFVEGKPLIDFTKHTALGALANYVATPTSNFVPMNVNFSIFADDLPRMKRKDKRSLYAKRSLDIINKIIEEEND